VRLAPGERVLAITNFPCGDKIPRGYRIRTKIVSVRHRNQHARRVRYPEPAMIAIVDAPDSSCETQIPISVLFAIGFRLGFWQSHSHGVFRHHF